MAFNSIPFATFFLSVLAWSAITDTQELSDTEEPRPQTKTQVVLLGTGSPAPVPERSGPAVAVVVNDSTFIIDAGAGVVRRAARAARERRVRALAPSYLNKVFITHLHSDHTLGLADLILTPAVVGREGPIDIYGPPGITSMTKNLLAAYEQDFRMRIEGLERGDPASYKVNVHEIEPGVVYESELAKVTAIQVNHGSWEHAYGYRIDTPDRSVVISGDTARSQALIDAAKGCDVFVHEVYSAQTLARLHPATQRYHSTFHTSGVELGKIAAEARPGILVLYHQLSWSLRKEIIAEIRQNYDGPMAYGNDLDIF